jgi:carbon starvation protein CstA
MLVFIIGLFVLIIGYFLYGRLVEFSVKPNSQQPTPAIQQADGVDFVSMPSWRIFLVQLLNIAGLGPIFGPILGALWGPQVFLWVVLGSILGGAAHDFFAGVMSTRNKGAGLPALIGQFLGPAARHAATFFILLLMILVGTVFVKAPAGLIVKFLPDALIETAGADNWLWLTMGVIFSYYLVATLLPVDKIIGRLYPIFAICLLIMVIGLAAVTLFGDLAAPSFSLANLHPEQTPAWPIIFITVSCGAISGFHATQSPLMARCIKTEKHMRPIFYGAMIIEAFIALIWASASQGYFGSVDRLAAALAQGGPAAVVHDVCVGTMGMFGGILALIGVVVLPITSGDTAFRVARLILADYVKLSQKPVINRYKIALPLFGISLALQFLPFDIIWRYFGWANQTLAAVTLWTAAVFLAQQGRMWWLAALPATFMTIMTSSYLMIAQEGFGLSQMSGTILGLSLGFASLIVFLFSLRRIV